METVIKITQLLLSLSLLVIIHEFGHFLFAKIFKCRVEKFYLFFNPWFSIFKKKIGETEYGIGWLPLGGFVKISGMVDESMDKEQLAQPAQPWEFRSKPAWQRMLIIVGGVMMNLVLAMIIYIGITFAWGESYVKTEDVKQGFVFSQTAQDLGFRNGDRIISVGGESIESYRQIHSQIILANPRQVVVERDEKFVTITVPDDKIKGMLNESEFLGLRFPFVVSAVAEGSPAQMAGLMAGDSLVGVDTLAMTYFDQYASFFADHANDTVMLSYVRGGSGAEVLQTPIVISDKGMIGVKLEQNLSKYYKLSTADYSLLQSIPKGLERGTEQVENYLKQLKLIASPETEAYKSVGGFITMGKIFPAEWDWYSFWNITALLSIMLAVINILPIPMLDGGHFVFILYEMITRRAPSQKFMEAAQYVGLALVLALVVYANGNDIIKLFQ